MLKQTLLASWVICLGAAFCSAAQSAELGIQNRNVKSYEAKPACWYRCGCLVVTHVRHREISMTFSPESDPRRFDEPRYYPGPVRSYPRYATWCDGDLRYGSSNVLD